MGIKTFAAIVVGSYEISMKIFEFSGKRGMREIDHVRHSIELGTDTYTIGKISYGRVDEVCSILKQFQQIMAGYQTSEYKAYGTSAIRETENTMIILEQIRIRTGIEISVLSNSEQRFMDYKSLAAKGENFSKIIEKSTAIIDISGGSIQVSIFDKDSLIATQNMKIGVLRIRESLNQLQPVSGHYEELIREMVGSQLALFKKLYLKDRSIQNVILVDDYVSMILQNRKVEGSREAGYIDNLSYEKFVNKMKEKSVTEIAAILGIAEENAFLLYVSAVIVKVALETSGAELVWGPGVTLCDGVAYEYAEKNKMITTEHDFEQDIIACAQNISKRYMGSKKRAETLEQISMTIFDNIKKLHGLGKRERLLLRLAALLHDCGKFISLSTVGECSHSIIMATEIIGISHMEREIVANVVRYNHLDFEYYDEIGKTTGLDRQAYLITAKLTAILRVANGLDRSHKQKFKNIKTVFRDDELFITVETSEDITLEKGLFVSKADFFEEVFSIRPVIKHRKTF